MSLWLLRAKTWLWWGAWAYAVGSNFYLLLYLLTGMSIPVVAQLIHIAHWIVGGGAVAGLLLALYPQRRRWALLGVAGMVAFVSWYGAYFTSPSHGQADASNTLTVATYNLRDDTVEENREVDDILRGMDADIVGLQEVGPSQVRYFKTELADLYPYQAYKMNQRFDMVAILSRYPILATNVPADRQLTRPSVESIRYLRAVVEVEGQAVAVYAFHPMRPRFGLVTRYDDSYNRYNVQQLLTELATETLPTLMLCDCNTSPLTPQHQWLDGHLDDLQQQVGWGLGLTHSGLPFLPFRNTRIDYVWYSADFAPVRVQVWKEQGHSDHHPVRGVLTWQSGG